MVDEKTVKKVVEDVLLSVMKEMGSPEAPGREHIVPVNMSNRHVHIKKEHIEQLFGPGAVLKVLRPRWSHS